MIKVYLGEDTPTQALFLRGLLQRQTGLEPVVFGDGLELYQAIQENPPDLVISDNVLPTLDGLSIARLVKFHEDTENIPFMLVSAMQRDQLHGLEDSGVDVFLPKPLKPATLKETINRLLDRQEVG